jgi:putative phage-type endonuclease
MASSHNCEQRSEAWFTARLGKVTASRVADVVAKTKTGYSSSRANYMAELVCEILTGTRAEGFTNAAMQWGTEQEPVARDAYSAHVGELVEEVGFLVHPTIDQAGASPDGHVDKDGMVEIKCPNTATHIETLLTKKPAGKYITQMQWQMACAGRAWCDFVTFDPRMPEGLQLFVTRIERDQALIQTLEDEVRSFLQEMNQTVTKLKELKL